jgi:putative aminopeptidase FrvX
MLDASLLHRLAQPTWAESWPWQALAQLLRAHAPSGGAGLRGAIGPLIGQLAAELGLGDGWTPRLGATGNAALWLGPSRTRADLVIAAHMDRPSFRVRDAQRGALYPICANRFPDGLYTAQAKALRFRAEEGLIVAARGTLASQRGPQGDSLILESHEGRLAWHDLVTLEAEPRLDEGGVVRGTGLDNSLGVLAALLAAARLRALPAWDDLSVLFVFTDQEEGDPQAFFGHGAARLAYALPPPRLGTIILDAHGILADSPIIGGQGASHGTISAWGRGSIVPPQAIALALDLAQVVNAWRPATVQFNTGYMSRSDDLALGRWSQILALIGPPMRDAHTAHESAHLADVESASLWLVCFCAALLNPDLAARYEMA